uniref:RWP-RK domain-containing protein n=1 Tax=Auxenochlorella protothecoides TaxID=3075 RepID=A0A1D2A4X3_AUXPR
MVDAGLSWHGEDAGSKHQPEALTRVPPYMLESTPATNLHGSDSGPSRTRSTRRKLSKHGVLASSITLEDVAAHFHLPADKACQQLGISLTVLKRVCRRVGVDRWPYRRVKSLERIFHSLNDAPGSGAARDAVQPLSGGPPRPHPGLDSQHLATWSSEESALGTVVLHAGAPGSPRRALLHGGAALDLGCASPDTSGREDGGCEAPTPRRSSDESMAALLRAALPEVLERGAAAGPAPRERRKGTDGFASGSTSDASARPEARPDGDVSSLRAATPAAPGPAGFDFEISLKPMLEGGGGPASDPGPTRTAPSKGLVGGGFAFQPYRRPGTTPPPRDSRPPPPRPRPHSPGAHSPHARRSSFVAPGPLRVGPAAATYPGPRHASPRHATPRHPSPRHATPRHPSPRHASPRHASPRRAHRGGAGAQPGSPRLVGLLQRLLGKLVSEREAPAPWSHAPQPAPPALARPAYAPAQPLARPWTGGASHWPETQAWAQGPSQPDAAAVRQQLESLARQLGHTLCDVQLQPHAARP